MERKSCNKMMGSRQGGVIQGGAVVRGARSPWGWEVLHWRGMLVRSEHYSACTYCTYCT